MGGNATIERHIQFAVLIMKKKDELQDVQQTQVARLSVFHGQGAWLLSKGGKRGNILGGVVLL